MVKLLSGVSAIVLAGAMASGQDSPRTPVDVSRLGPQVGSRVPDFALKDQSGRAWTLSSLMGPRGAMLVFYRSADW
ncbi:MAG: hypothetical protein AB7Q16_05500 [Vicinamibacterales bacterium]